MTHALIEDLPVMFVQIASAVENLVVDTVWATSGTLNRWPSGAGL